MDPTLFELTRMHPCFTYEAFEFVCEVVEYTQEMLGRVPRDQDDPNTDYHVSGEELLRGAVELAILEFGMMASTVFRQWGIFTTDDFGQMVFLLIEAGKLSGSERDDLTDFHDVFDLGKALTEGFVMTAEFDKPRKGGR